jgi:type I restriction enzyme S subunit
MVPNDWKQGKVGDFLFLQRGFDLTKKQSIAGTYPVYSSSGLAYFHNEAKVKGPGVVTGRKGCVGPVYLIDIDFWPHDPTLWVKDFKGNDTLFTKYFLTHLNLAQLDEASSVPTLNRNNVHRLKCVFPPVAEQLKIAKILSTWDHAIALKEQLLCNSKKQKQWLMQHLLTEKKLLSDQVRKWKKTTLGNLGHTFSGLVGKSKDDFGSGHHYIPYKNIFNNSAIDINSFDLVKIEPNENQAKVQFGDIFFTVSSETPEEVGMSSVLLQELDKVYLNSFCFGLRLFNFETLAPEYARYLLRSNSMRKAISALAQGATRYNISKRRLMQLEVLLPPIAEQQKIAKILLAADDEISNHQYQLDNLKLEKRALMQQLLTGKRRVKVEAA